MAKLTVVVDDIDGSVDAAPVAFGFDGFAYAIDLSAKNRDRLTRSLAPFIERATRVPGQPRKRQRGGGR